MAMQIDIERSSDHGGRNDILLMVPNNLFTCGFNTHRKYLNSGFILLLCIAIGKYWNTGSYSRSSSIHKHTVNSRCFNVIRNILLKKPYLYCYWVATINIILIVIANISILNPGPTIDNNLSNISLMYLNVRGFVRFYELKSKSPTFYTNKILEFQSYIFEKKTGVVVLNETWLSKGIKDNEIFPNESYKVFRLDRSLDTHPYDPANPKKYRKNGGGVIIAVRSDLDVQSTLIKVKCKAEILSVLLKFSDGRSMCITTLYRVGTLGDNNYDEVNSYLNKISCMKCVNKHILVGDINLNNTSWPDGTSTCGIDNKFLGMFNDLGFDQLVNGPTHEDGKTLDLVLCNSNNIITNLNILPQNYICKSDHNGITLDINLKVKRKKCPKRKIYNFKKANWNKLNEDLKNVPWGDYLKYNDAESAWNIFKSIFLKLCDMNIPKVTMKSKLQPPWFDSESYHLCREKERWRAKFKKTKNPEDQLRFKAARKLFRQSMQEKQRSSLEDKDDPSLMSKKFWSYVKSTSNSTRIPETVSYGNKFRNKPVDQAEIFNDYFYDQFSSPSKYNIHINFQNDPNHDFYISRFGVEKLLHNINPNKAAGPDGVHGKILKNCAKSLALPLSLLFTKSFKTGLIPSEWKSANVVPVFKKGEKISVKKYRPISLTCLVMKTFEVCIRDKLMDMCKGQINFQQHGFLAKKSCITQMVPFIDDLSCTLNNRSRTDVIYFDFAKAFDSVSHDIILCKLKYQYNIDGMMLKFLKNYLENRSQCVIIGGERSTMKPVISGVPQGSILGPLLFVLFINDMNECIKQPTKIALYADDTKLWREIKTFSDHIELQNDINSLLNWSNLNKMTFHPDKCKVLAVSNQRDREIFPFYDNFQYCLGNTCLNYVQSEKDLGVYISTNLTWTEQCTELISKGNSMLGLIKRTCNFTIDPKQRRALYLSLVRSKFEHCSVIWKPHNTTLENKLEAMQKRAVKWIYSECFATYTPNEYLEKLEKVDLLPMAEKLAYSDLLLFHRIIHNDICIKLPPYIILSTAPNNNRGMNTRLFDALTESFDDLKLVSIVKPNIIAFEKNFFFRTHLKWNSLPLTIRILEGHDQFKIALKKHLWNVLMERPD